MQDLKLSFFNSEKLPLVIQPVSPFKSKSDFYHLLSSNCDYFKQNLLRYGGILFRGFPLENADDFAACIRHLGTGKSLDYIGGDSPRNKIQEGIYTSTEAPPSIKIPLHNELSFVELHPKHIYFFCEIPSKLGGSTIIADSRKIYHAVSNEIKDKFIKKRLRYESCYYFKSRLMNFVNALQPSHKSWIQVFETESKEEVERKCREHKFDYQWQKNGWLKISQVRPATLVHPETGEEIWFNQAHLYDFNPKLLGAWRYIAAKVFYCQKHTKLHQVFFADLDPIPREDLYHIMDVLDEHTISFPWEKGDLLLLDNLLTMHGRGTFKGKRRILTSMTS